MAKKEADSKAAKSKNTAKAKKKGGIKKYFRDLKSEIQKVVWPTRAQVFKNTGVVLSMVVALGLLLFGIDTGLAAAIKAILNMGS